MIVVIGGAALTSKKIIKSFEELQLRKFVGVDHKNLRWIENTFEVSINIDSDSLSIVGHGDIDSAERLIMFAFKVLEKYESFEEADLQVLLDIIKLGKEDQFLDQIDDVLVRTFTGKPIKARTLGQKLFIDTIKKFDLSFAIGPAGTGKTFLAVCYAVSLLKEGEIKRIILTRPAVESGENLGFLPGDLKEKVDPYLRPIYDALDILLGSERVERYIEKGIIEIAPLAYMRGRTLDDALVILDEAQNTTRAQMLMFLSRLGRNGKMIVNGDVDQIDLLRNQQSGLVVAKEVLGDIKDIGFVHLSYTDIVRHPLVTKILKAFATGDYNE